MKIASVADIKARFSAYLRAAERGPVVVTRSGKPVGVLLAVDGEEELERLVLAYTPAANDSGCCSAAHSGRTRHSARGFVAGVGRWQQEQAAGCATWKNGLSDC